MKIKEVMQHIKDRELPCVSETSDLSDVVKVVTCFPHTRLVYVIDDQKKLRGVITIDSLMHHLYLIIMKPRYILGVYCETLPQKKPCM